MRPAPGSVEGHREWWARIVGSAAYAPRAGSGASSDEAAPVASLIAALGPPTSLSPDHSPMRDDNFELWMFALLSIALLTEWASRRWRGAP
jgi:hypothetical protein